MTSNTEDFTSDEVVNGGVGNGQSHQDAAAASSITKGAIEDRKIFIGGLSWETTEQDLAEYFGKIGELESVNLKMDMVTGRSRCFAFLLFKSSDSVDKVLSSKEHVISNKNVDVKRAKAKPGKIYVGGLVDGLTEEAIRDYFTTNFGPVAEIESPYDKVRQQRKNFCFVTFEREEVLKDVLAVGRQKIGEFAVDVKKASPRPKMPMMGGGGPWGAYNGYYGGYGPPYGGGYYDYGGYYGGWGGGAEGGEAGGDAGGGKMGREGGGARVTPY